LSSLSATRPGKVNELGRHYIAFSSLAVDGDCSYERHDPGSRRVVTRVAEVGLTLREMQVLDLPQAEKDKIYYQNARRILPAR